MGNDEIPEGVIRIQMTLTDFKVFKEYLRYLGVVIKENEKNDE